MPGAFRRSDFGESTAEFGETPESGESQATSMDDAEALPVDYSGARCGSGLASEDAGVSPGSLRKNGRFDAARLSRTGRVGDVNSFTKK